MRRNVIIKTAAVGLFYCDWSLFKFSRTRPSIVAGAGIRRRCPCALVNKTFEIKTFPAPTF